MAQSSPAVLGPVESSVRQHTPGPWTCFYKSKYDEWHVSVPMSQGSMNWALFDDGVRSENPEADARLIAAAPDLLAALQALRLAREQNKYPSWEKGVPMFNEAESMADAAIAKALGLAA